MRLPAVAVVLCLSLVGCANQPPPPQNTEASTPQVAAKVRKFTFHYKFRVKDLNSIAGAKDSVRVWIPVPSETAHQEVKVLPATAPGDLEETKEARYGNRLRYFSIGLPKEGEFTVDLPYEIVRREVLTPAPGSKSKLRDAERNDLLAANKLVPTDGKPLELLQDRTLPADSMAKARQLYDLVDEHVVYKKEGTGWGRGDTNWVCENGYGNCTDFHSLFMSLARSQGVPAQFEIGFSIPTDKKEGPIAGYHCWAWFHTPERGWVPVDISEADKAPAMKDYFFGNLTADRVVFSTGRDLELEPPPAEGPVNFLVYPHIEVGGRVLPKENMELEFSFQDQ